MEEIKKNESSHFPLHRCIAFLVTLILLFTTSIMVGNKYQTEQFVDPFIAYIMLAIFVTYSVVSTIANTRKLGRIHAVKRRDGYPYDPTDFKFDNRKAMVKVVAFCFLAGLLGGIVGISGGIILAPLLLQLGMLPVLVSSTN